MHYSAPGIIADEEAENRALGLRRRSNGHADLGELDLQLGEPVTSCRGGVTDIIVLHFFPLKMFM